MNWTTVCELKDIVPGTGVCALVADHQVAIFRPDTSEQVYALDNLDPFFHASVLSRGLLVEHQGKLWVASPLKKQRFSLSDGECMESMDHSVRSYPARVHDGKVEVRC